MARTWKFVIVLKGDINMSRFMNRKVIAAVAAVIALSLAGIATMARDADPRSGEVNRAKEIAALIEKGQLPLRAAAEIAEKHLKGTALEARAEIRTSVEPDPKRPHSSTPSGATGTNAAAMRIIYEVSCFSGDKVEKVRVDAVTRKVVEETAEERSGDKG